MVATPDLIVEVGFTAGASTSTWLHWDDATRGRWDETTWAPEDVWEDVTPWVRSTHITRPSTRNDGPHFSYEAGTLSLLLNNGDRRFDPLNLDGPYVAAGVTQVTPMRAIRVRATWDGVTYDLFRGFIDAMPIDYTADGNWAEVNLTATDAFKVLSNISREAVDPAVGASEDSGARVGRILDSVDWSDVDRVVAAGDTTLQETTLEGDALAELQAVTETELGVLYIDGAGRVVFRNRLAVLAENRSINPQAVFTDGTMVSPRMVGLGGGLSISPGGSDGLPFKTVTPEYDDTQLVNDARVSAAGGDPQTVQDATSIGTYLRRTFERSDLLMETDEEAAAYAGWVVWQSKNPELRFSQITIDPQRDPDRLYPQVLGREVGDRITIALTPPGGGDPIERDVIIRGIDHGDLTPGLWGPTTWTLQDAGKQQFLVWDHPTLGVWDDSAWVY